MKASELIEELQKMIDQHGDKDVTVYDPEHGDTMDIVKPDYVKGEFVL